MISADLPPPGLVNQLDPDFFGPHPENPEIRDIRSYDRALCIFDELMQHNSHVVLKPLANALAPCKRSLTVNSETSAVVSERIERK